MEPTEVIVSLHEFMHFLHVIFFFRRRLFPQQLVCQNERSIDLSDRLETDRQKHTKKEKKQMKEMKAIVPATSAKVRSLSVEDIKAATVALIALRGTMSSVKALTPEQRREYYRQRLGPQTLRVLDNRVMAARQHRHLLPPSFDLRKFERDTALVGELQECLAAADQLMTIVQDALLPVASRAVQAGSVAYAHIKASPGAAEQIKRSVGKLSMRANRGRPVSPGDTPAPAPVPAPATPPAPVVVTSSVPPAPEDKPENKAA
jgi:hypothetical protein